LPEPYNPNEKKSSKITKFTEDHEILLENGKAKFYVKTFIKKKVNEIRINFKEDSLSLGNGEMV